MKPIRVFLSALSLSLFLNACTPGEDVIGSEANIKYVNTWMMNILHTYYYWTDKLPRTSDKTLNPNDYFQSVMYWYDPVTAPDGDRFSWIQEDYVKLKSSLNGVVPTEIGFDIALYYKDKAHTDVIGQVNYIKKGTPAELSGIKRGMYFDRINGTVMNKSNYSSLLNITSADVTIGFIKPTYNAQGAFIDFVTSTEITVQTVANYAENPVYMDSVFTLNNRKIGYFVYHFFADDDGLGSYSYDLDMNAAFGRFKAAGITDMILDLRYNSGGKATSSQLLASELVPDLIDTKLFCYYRFNTDLTARYTAEQMKTYFTTKLMKETVQLGTVNNIGNQLGGKLYVLTGPNTASASEQVINGLKPYMNVVLIGDTTLGKNVGSTTFFDEGNTDKNKWGLQPIIAKNYNSLGQSDYKTGFFPDFPVQEGGGYMKDFGDPNEPLLKTALDDILGNSTNQQVQKRAGILQADKHLSIPSKRIRGLQLDNLPFFE